MKKKIYEKNIRTHCVPYYEDQKSLFDPYNVTRSQV